VARRLGRSLPPLDRPFRRARQQKSSALGIAILLASCSGYGSSVGRITPSTIAGSQALHTSSVVACSSVMTSSGQPHTVARLGGGDRIDVESSAYANCDIGIYIGAAHGPASLDHTVVNGPFKIAVYIDNVGSMHEDHTSICVNGADSDGMCRSGSKSSTGTALDVQNTPNISIDHTNIDGYAVGFATSPCPNPVGKGRNANNIKLDHTTITNSTNPWSFMGGDIDVKHAAPTPPAGGSCAGSGVNASSFTATVAAIPGSKAANLVPATSVWQGLPGIKLKSVDFVTPNGAGVLGVIDPDRKFGWLAPWPAISNNLGLAFDAQSTAVTIVWLNPAIFSAANESTIVSTLQRLPAIAALAAALQASAFVYPNPFSSPTVASAYQAAVQAAITSLGSLSIHVRSQSLLRSRMASSPQLCVTNSSANISVMPLSCYEGLAATKLTVSTDGTTSVGWNSTFATGLFGTGEALSWFGSVYQINTSCYSSAQQLQNVFSFNAWASTPPGAPGQCGTTSQIEIYPGIVTLSNGGKPLSSVLPYLSPNYGDIGYLDFISDIVSLLTNQLGQQPSGSSFNLGPTPAVYDVGLYSCGVLTSVNPLKGSQVNTIASNDLSLIGTFDSGYGLLTPGWQGVGESCGAGVLAVALDLLSAKISLTTGSSKLNPELQSCVVSTGIGLPTTIENSLASSSSLTSAVISQVLSFEQCVDIAINKDQGGLLAGVFGDGVDALLGAVNVVANGAEVGDIIGSAGSLQPWEGYIVQVGNPWPTTGNGSATELAFLSPPSSLTAGVASTPFTVVTAGSNGVGAPVAIATTISLISSAPGTFSQNSIAIPAGTFGNLFPGLPNGPDSVTFTPSQPGPVTLTASAPGLGSKSITLNASASTNLLFDNFKSDNSLNSSLFVVNGPVAVAALTNFDANPTATIVTPAIAFSPSLGLGVGAPAGGYQQGGIQSVQSFTPPFTLTASGLATSISAGVLQLAISTQNGGSGVDMDGGIGGVAATTGFDYTSPSGFGTHWNEVGQLSASAPTLNQLYTLAISVNASGVATVSVNTNGAQLGSATASVGNGPFYVILSEGSGAFSGGSPNQAYWSAIQVTTP